MPIRPRLGADRDREMDSEIPTPEGALRRRGSIAGRTCPEGSCLSSRPALVLAGPQLLLVSRSGAQHRVPKHTLREPPQTPWSCSAPRSPVKCLAFAA